jgi:hypothetical protein
MPLKFGFAVTIRRGRPSGAEGHRLAGNGFPAGERKPRRHQVIAKRCVDTWVGAKQLSAVVHPASNLGSQRRAET